MTLEPPTEEQLTLMYKQINMTPESLERDVKYLKEWISQQPHLPNGIDERILRGALIARKNSIERVKECIDLGYTVKRFAPEFYEGRDPLDPGLEDYMNRQSTIFVPKLTPEGGRVVIIRLWNFDASRYECSKSVKFGLMVAAIALLEVRCLNWIAVIDLRDITLGILSKLPLPLCRKAFYIVQKVYPIRVKEIHLIYAPTYVDTLVNFFKPFLKKKLVDRIHIHPGGIGTLCDYVPQEILPVDYGGNEIPLRQMHENWKKKLLEYRDWFLEDNKLVVDESKRPGKPKTHDSMFGFEGSFRQLSID